MILVWIVTGLLVVGVGGFLILYFVLAPRNLWFTFVEEGTAKIVFRAGKFKKALIQWEGWTFDEDWNVVSGREIHRFGGLRFYGWWPLDDIYTYEFSWTGIREDGRIVPHEKELLDYVLLKEDVYWAKVEKAEDKKLLPLDVELVLTIRVVNPYKALFAIEDWLEAAINRVRPSVRNAITADIYERLIKKPEAVGEMIYERLTAPGGLIEEVKERYGVDLRRTQVKDINPPEGYRDLTLKKFIAEKERDRILVEADAEAKRLKRVAEGESHRIEIEYGKVKEFEDLGRLIRTLEALEESPAQGAKWIISLPGGAEFLRDIFGRPLETVSREEFRELREMIEKMSQ